MATYFPSPENQRETLPCTYSEGPVHPGNMMMYMNYASSSSGSYSGTLPGIAQQQTSRISIIPGAGASDSNPSQQEILSHLGGSRVGEQDLNEWKDDRSSMLLMQHHHHHHPMGVFQGQGLSLTLSTHVPPGFQMSSFQCRTPDQGFSSFLSSSQDTGRNGSLGNNIDVGSPNKQSRIPEYVPTGYPGANVDQMTADASQYGISGGSITRAIPNSKYLKAAQQLLDEVVNVKKALKEQQQCKNNRSVKDSSKSAEGGTKSGASEPPGTGSSSNLEESSPNSPAELSAAEKQELQNKMTKLLAMLDEVDRRYKQYHHQMQIVVSSFDVVAGCGAAKPYTALALQTISRHFRCLRDAIGEQLQITRKNLGEQDAAAENCKGIGISRLRYVDQQIRQQRALQQIGMMQQHAWRPQRGLPESSVSVLRAWLFEHFLHPYPKDSDKIMLARQTGLTRSQVSNWFINARVRLWKPMVEEMYKEEIGDGEMDINSPSDLATKPTNSEAKASEEDLQQSTTSTPTQRCSTGQLYELRSDDHFADVELTEPNHNIDLAYTTNMGHTETEDDEYAVGLVKSRGNRGLESNEHDDCTMIQSSEGSNRLMAAAAAAAAAAYHMSELERFENNGSGVSLTLGLQQCEGSSIPMSIETHQGYVPTTMRGDTIYAAAAAAASSMGPDATEFDCMDGTNRVTTHQRFSSSHLLHDFVA